MSFAMLIKKAQGWTVATDTNGDIRQSTTAEDLLNEFKTSYALSSLQPVEILDVDYDSITVTGGSNSATVALIENMREETE